MRMAFEQTFAVSEVPHIAGVVYAHACEHARQDKATVIALSGELGAGKTTLVQALAQSLGVTAPITSPTFVIQKHYDTTDGVFARLVHIDAYRIEEDRELVQLGFDALCATPHTLIIIEWAEHVERLLEEPLRVTLEYVDQEHRRIHINDNQRST